MVGDLNRNGIGSLPTGDRLHIRLFHSMMVEFPQEILHQDTDREGETVNGAEPFFFQEPNIVIVIGGSIALQVA